MIVLRPRSRTACLLASLVALAALSAPTQAQQWREPVRPQPGPPAALEFGVILEDMIFGEVLGEESFSPRPFGPQFGPRFAPGFDERPRPVSIFDDLAPYGEVIELRGQAVWRPYVDRGWRPFEVGRWENGAEGWVWRGFEPWSGITDHTGSWRQAGRLGWVWQPPRTSAQSNWMPGRVGWRVGDGLVGWAPLGETDPDAFVFVPLEVFLDQEPGEILSPAETRSVFADTRAVPGLPAPGRLRASSAPPRRAALDEPPAPLSSDAPQGRFTTPEVVERPLSEAPVAARRTPPTPLPRPQIALAPTPETVTAPEPTTTAPANSENRTSETKKTETKAEPATDPKAPREVGPQWLANGDCSARGIREGRCRAE